MPWVPWPLPIQDVCGVKEMAVYLCSLGVLLRPNAPNSSTSQTKPCNMTCNMEDRQASVGKTGESGGKKAHKRDGMQAKRHKLDAR